MPPPLATFVQKDRVKETTLSTGTGTITLSGAVTGYQPFSVLGSNNTTHYAITNSTDWEVGLGTYFNSAGSDFLSRDTVFDSSNAGSAVNWGAGSKDVFCTYPAAKAVVTDAPNTFTSLQTVQDAALAVSATGAYAGDTFFSQSNALSSKNFRLASTSVATWYGSSMPLGGPVFDESGKYSVTATYPNFYLKTLTTPWDLTSSTNTVASKATAWYSSTTPYRTAFTGDGTAIWQLQSGGRVTRIPLTTPYNISTLGSYNFNSTTLTWASGGTQTVRWFDFIDSGTKIITLDSFSSPYKLKIWGLSVAYDLSSTATDLGSIDLQTDTFYVSYMFTEGGSKFLEIVATNASTTNYIRAWSLPTPYNFTLKTLIDVDSGALAGGLVVGGLIQTASGIIRYDESLAKGIYVNTTGAYYYSYLDNRIATLGGDGAYDYVDIPKGLVNLSNASGTLNSTGLSGGTYTANALSATTLTATGGATLSGYLASVQLGNSVSTGIVSLGPSLPGVLRINGLPIFSAFAYQNAAGTTQATAATIGSSHINSIIGVTPTTNGVLLPSATPGYRIIVRNTSTTDNLNVYPYTSDQINNLAVNAPYVLVPEASIELFSTSGINWYTL